MGFCLLACVFNQRRQIDAQNDSQMSPVQVTKLNGMRSICLFDMDSSRSLIHNQIFGLFVYVLHRCIYYSINEIDANPCVTRCRLIGVAVVLDLLVVSNMVVGSTQWWWWCLQLFFLVSNLPPPPPRGGISRNGYK